MAETISSRLVLIREEKGLSRREVATLLNIPYTTYCHYEDGSIELKVSSLLKLSAFYGISADWILGNETTKNLPPETRWEIMRKEIEQLSDDDVKELHSFLKFLLWREKQQD